MEFRIKSHKVYANGLGKLYTEWWTVQRRFLALWITQKNPVPYALFNEPVRYNKYEDAVSYVTERLSRPRKFKVIREVM